MSSRPQVSVDPGNDRSVTGPASPLRAAFDVCNRLGAPTDEAVLPMLLDPYALPPRTRADRYAGGTLTGG